VRNLVICVVLSSSAFAACGSDAPLATNGQYCASITKNLAQLRDPGIAESAAVDATIELYRSITAVAPLAVRKEWEVLVASVETAATVDPNDPASTQRVADTARSSQNAATAIADYTKKLCGVAPGDAAPPPSITTVGSSSP
jgi:hypothetical protein